MQVVQGGAVAARFGLGGGPYAAAEFSLAADGAGGTLLRTTHRLSAPVSAGPGRDFDPAYYLAQHPTVASVLTNPRVHIYTDDGRRWLLRHPESRFDFIVQNTTWNWRAHITDLESVDYLEIIRQHLAPGALFYFNTTESDDVQRTAALTFPFALRVYNFMAVSESKVGWDDARWQATLRGTIIDGAPAFDLTTEKGRAAFAESLERGRPNAATRPFESRSSVLARTAAAGLVTDDNMLPEWREVLRFPPPP